MHGGACCLDLPAAHKGTWFASAHDSSQIATTLTLLRSRHLEEEQQAALAALSEQLEAITSVEELTKLVSNCVPEQTVCWDGTCVGADPASFLCPSLLQLRAAGEYEERKLIRAAIRKLRAEEIEGEAQFPCSGVDVLESLGCGQLLPEHHLCSHPAATLAGNVQNSRRDGSKPPTVPGETKIVQRDNVETPALTGSEESCGKGSTKPPGTDKSGESSQQDDAEPALAGPEESGYQEAVEQHPAQEPKGSAVSM